MDREIIVRHGDEDSGEISRIQVTQPQIRKAGPTDLDGDGDMEYVVISRGSGSGPYYQLQILDFLTNAVISLAHPSLGEPRIEAGMIEIGFGSYQGAATNPQYEQYVYRAGQLVAK